jgi:hypothetical protein
MIHQYLFIEEPSNLRICFGGFDHGLKLVVIDHIVDQVVAGLFIGLKPNIGYAILFYFG